MRTWNVVTKVGNKNQITFTRRRDEGRYLSDIMSSLIEFHRHGPCFSLCDAFVNFYNFLWNSTNEPVGMNVYQWLINGLKSKATLW